MHLNANRVRVFFYHVDVEKCYFVYQNLVEIVLSPPHYYVHSQTIVYCNDAFKVFSIHYVGLEDLILVSFEILA